MDQLFGVMGQVSVPQECARAVLIFLFGLLLLRISGRRSFARWSALDIIISIIVGSALARAMTGNAPLFGTLAAVVLLMALHMVCAYFAARSDRFAWIVEGNAVVLGRDGALDHGARRRHLVSNCDMAEALRRENVDDVSATAKVVLEPSGRINVLKPKP
jgi:uncharacterized membrane protein YcaP (DUF421 family)